MRVRKNMSWLELGSRIMKLDKLHSTIQNVARGAIRRGMKWFAYRVTEVDKYGGRQPYGQWLWIPKANLIGHVSIAPPGSGGFITGQGSKTIPFSVSWSRPHPLARTVKEIWYAYNWGHSRRGKLQRYGSRDISLAPGYEHWLEAREIAKREGRTIAPWDKWRSEMSEPFHSTWWRQGEDFRHRRAGLERTHWKARSNSRNPGPRLRFKDLSVGEVFIFASQRDPRFLTSGMAKGPWIKRSTREYEHVDDVGKPVAQKRYGAFRIIVGSVNADVIRVQNSARNKGRISTSRRNPRITIQFYRDRNGVIRKWGTGSKASLPDRHVLLVDYKHGGIFDTWKKGGGRNFDLVKALDNPRRKSRR
jgi:hypothetical protein